MHPVHPHNPGLLQVATQAQHMATHAKQERLALAFQTVSMVSVAIVGAAAGVHLLRELLRANHREEKGRSRG